MTINGGTFNAVLGGGPSSAVVNGVEYMTGTQEHPELSGTRVETANVTINGGTIDTLNVGGEDASDVTDVIEAVDLKILGGTVTTLNSGISNSVPLDVTQPGFVVVTVEGTVTNDNLPSGGSTEITFTIQIDPSSVVVLENNIFNLDLIIETTPAGYESSFENVPVDWSSSDTAIFVVDENGVITGKSEGSAVVTATLLNGTATTDVVVENNAVFIILIIFFILIIVFLFFLLIFW